jgi:hypothetical protein
MAIDAVGFSVEMRPEIVVLVTGNADIAHLAFQLRAWDSCGSGPDRSNPGQWIEGHSKRGDRSGLPGSYEQKSASTKAT